MRNLTDHIVDGDSANNQLSIQVIDEPGQGGACHSYEITGLDTSKNNSEKFEEATCEKVHILFQNGPIKQFGVNGVTHEALLTILIDRLASFQKGPYTCDDNENALKHLCFALRLLQKRTKARIDRGVEGTHIK